ncbi:MAG: hypothetical protein H0X24_07565 [Ktedonobacterales bacterium]|nr:hypothetical protein [Ktedonobacterales bacterium]
MNASPRPTPPQRERPKIVLVTLPDTPNTRRLAAVCQRIRASYAPSAKAA